jgi:hypothetical protein
VFGQPVDGGQREQGHGRRVSEGGAAGHRRAAFYMSV